MKALFPDIKTNNWQISTVGVGYIAEGLADIRQCLNILLRTAKGSDPLRPEFGCDIFRFIDRPLNFAIPNIKRSIIEAIEIWEKRVTLKRITHEIEVSHVRFKVVVALVDGELLDLILVYLNGGFVPADETDTGSLTLFALYPPNPNNRRYNISLVLNNVAATPAPPAGGFGTLPQLIEWVFANWSSYGHWEKTGDRLILHANHIYTTGSISISLAIDNRFFAVIPLLDLGQGYAFSFSSPQIPVAYGQSFATMGEMLLWAQTHLSAYGIWLIETNPAHGGDFDLSDFDLSDFDAGSAALYLLVLMTHVLDAATIEVTAV
jgi:phage baseplate assembly protein W